MEKKTIFAVCMTILITAAFFTGMIKGMDMTEKTTEKELVEDQRLALLSAKIYFRSGGQYWINPYTIEIEPTPKYILPEAFELQ